MQKIAIIAEFDEADLCPINAELAAFASTMASLVPAEIRMVVVGRDIRKRAAAVGATFGFPVTAIRVAEVP
ncbi:MAG: hypothetical protein JJV98_08295, partial [Desulfosarcina sp.]|nr:hypothetical protein [Desulfobacterales bacterium]